MSQPPHGSPYGPPVDPYQTPPAWGAPHFEEPPYQPTPNYGWPVPPPPPPPVPPQPPRRGPGAALVVVLVVVLVLVVVGGGIGIAFWLTKGGSGTPAATGPSAGASANPAGATHTGDLRSYLIPSPSGAKPWSKPLGTDRNLSLDQAAELSSDPNGRRDMLNRYHFAKGAVQCWIASGGSSVVDVRLYQFDTATDADGFFRQNIDATGRGYAAGDTSPVAGVARATSFATNKKDSQGLVGVISIGIKDDVVFVVSVGEKSDTVDLSLPTQLMRQQSAKL